MLAEPMSLLIDGCLRATPVLAAAWLLARAMHRASAATRHCLWACAIAGAALMPISAAFTPRWEIPAPPVVHSLSRMAPQPGSTTRRDNVVAAFATPSPTRTSDRQSVQPPLEVNAVQGATEARHDRAVAAIAIVWALGTGVILFYLGVGTLAAWWLRRVAVPIGAPWVEDACTLAETFGVRRRITCVESPAARTPMVSGLWRPTIVMPMDVARWPDDRVRAVVLHEIAHVKRRDCWTQVLAQVVCAVYWVNPLVWVAARRLRAERERACDDFVLAAGMKGSEYAGHLLAIALATRPRISMFATAGLTMGHRQHLEGRLTAILDPSVRRSSTLYARLIAAAAVVMISGPPSAVRLETIATPSTATTTEVVLDGRPSTPSPTSVPDRTRSVAPSVEPEATVTPDEFVARVTQPATDMDQPTVAIGSSHPGQPTAARGLIEPISLSAQAQAPPRTVLLIVDELHLDFRATPKVRQLAGRLLRPLIGEGVLCGLVSTGTSGISVAPTSESTALERGISSLVGSELKLSELRAAQGRPVHEQEVRHRADIAFSIAADTITAAAAGRNGTPLTVLYLSSGYDGRLVPVPTELLQTAARANAAIYTIDPRGFDKAIQNQSVSQADWDAYVEATRGSLSALANQTKGMAVFTADDLDALQSRLAMPGR